MKKHTAIYIRVSTAQQSTQSQKPDLNRWIEAQDPQQIGEVKWYEDKSTGKNMERPAWQKIQAAINLGKVSRLVVWRLDRLGRTASGLCKLFDDLQEKKVRLVSLMDSIDLGTPSGRLIANVLASVAAYETEVRGERVRAGQKAALAKGKKWGGSKKGRRIESAHFSIIWFNRCKYNSLGGFGHVRPFLYKPDQVRIFGNDFGSTGGNTVFHCSCK